MKPSSNPSASENILHGDEQPWAFRKIRFSWLASFAFGVFCVVAATLARMALGWVTGTNLTFVLFFPAVLFATLTAGVGSGLVAIALSIIVTWWAFVPPLFTFELPKSLDFANFFVFAISSLLVVWLAERHRQLIVNYQKQTDELAVARPKVADLHRTTALFEAVINMTPDLVYVKDRQSRALLRNPAALLGSSWEDVKGREEADWHQNPEEAKQVVANDRKVIETGTSMQFVEQFTTPDGVRTLLSTNHRCPTKRETSSASLAFRPISPSGKNAQSTSNSSCANYRTVRKTC